MRHRKMQMRAKATEPWRTNLQLLSRKKPPPIHRSTAIRRARYWRNILKPTTHCRLIDFLFDLEWLPICQQQPTTSQAAPLTQQPSFCQAPGAHKQPKAGHSSDSHRNRSAEPSLAYGRSAGQSTGQHSPVRSVCGSAAGPDRRRRGVVGHTAEDHVVVEQNRLKVIEQYQFIK